MTSVDPTPASGMEAKALADILERTLHSQRITANVQVAPDLVASIVATLRSAETSAAVGGVCIKPLRWSEPHPSITYPNWYAMVAAVRFEARIDTSCAAMYGKFPLRINGSMVVEKFDTLDAAKLHAEERYSALVSSLLSFPIPRPAPVELEGRAREMLAAEYATEAFIVADDTSLLGDRDRIAIRAIIAALSTVPAVDAGAVDDRRGPLAAKIAMDGANIAALALPASNAASDAVEREYQIDCPNCGGEGTLEHPHLGGMPSYAAECPPDAVVVDCEECQGTGQKWTDDPCTLLECPPGLFRHEDTLGFKSEYYSAPNKPDAYCVESGEYFWGGTSDVNVRANLLVQPVAALNRRTDAGGAK